MNRSHAKYIAGLPVGAHKIHPNRNFLKKSPTPHFRGKSLRNRVSVSLYQKFAVHAKNGRKKSEIPAKVVQGIRKSTPKTIVYYVQQRKTRTQQ